eukprot:472738_1
MCAYITCILMLMYCTIAEDADINIQLDEALYCGQKMSANVNTYTYANYHAFTLNRQSNVMFDACNSSYDVDLYLDLLYNNSYIYIDHCHNCGSSETTSISSKLQVFALPAATYILQVIHNTFDEYYYQLSIRCDEFEFATELHCNDSINKQLNSSYYFDSYYFTLNKDAHVLFDTLASNTQLYYLSKYIEFRGFYFYFFDAAECNAYFECDPNFGTSIDSRLYTAGQYHFGIGGYDVQQQYNLSIYCAEETSLLTLYCNHNVNVKQDALYYFDRHLFILDKPSTIVIDVSAANRFWFESFDVVDDISMVLPVGNYSLSIEGYNNYKEYNVTVICKDPIFGERLSCNANVIGQTNSSSVVNYHPFTLNSTSYVVFDSCNSSYDTQLNLYYSNFTLIQGCDDCGECTSLNEQLKLPILVSGDYVLAIYGYNQLYGEYNVFVDCFAEVNESIVVPINRSYSKMFVDNVGIDNIGCGTEANPCSTIRFSVYLISNRYTYININEIVVKGQGIKSIKQNIINSKSSPCFIDEDGFDKSMIITFDIDDSQWYPHICDRSIIFNIWDHNIVFNNMRIGNMEEIVFTSMYSSESLILNNCMFYNVSEFRVLTLDRSYLSVTINNSYFYKIKTNIFAQSVQIFDTVFDDIEGLSNSIIDISPPDDTSLDLTFYMKNCTIINAYNYESFIEFNGQNIHSNIRKIYISDTLFNDIKSSYSLIKSSSFLDTATVIIDISTSSFKQINEGSILIAKGKHHIIIDDLSITTDQSTENIVNADLLSLFLFSNNVDSCITNVELKYLGQMRNCAEGFYPGEAWGVRLHYFLCSDPIQFIYNNGITNITNFNVSNNILFNNKYQYYPMCSNNNIRCQFYFKSIVQDGDYALIDNNGELIVNNFQIHGTGIMSQLIKNKGNAHINTAISQYHFYSEIFDPYVLNIH